MEQIVRIVNPTDTDYVQEYEFVTYRVPAGGEALFPSGVAECWFGDWRTKNTDRWKERREEFRRMQVMYGAYDDPVAWEEQRPRLEVYTSTGERIWTVCDDPEGTRGLSPEVVGGQPNSAIDRIEQLTRELDALRATIALDSPGGLAASESFTDQPAAAVNQAPSDSPPPVTGSQPRKSGEQRMPVGPPNVDIPKDAPSRVGIS